MLDKLQQTPKFNRIVKLYETLGSGYYNITKGIDLGLFSLFTERMMWKETESDWEQERTSQEMILGEFSFTPLTGLKINR
jgi:hypothetical protein